MNGDGVPGFILTKTEALHRDSDWYAYVVASKYTYPFLGLKNKPLFKSSLDELF